jgi:hypothetical protein
MSEVKWARSRVPSSGHQAIGVPPIVESSPYAARKDSQCRVKGGRFPSRTASTNRRQMSSPMDHLGPDDTPQGTSVRSSFGKRPFMSPSQGSR